MRQLIFLIVLVFGFSLVSAYNTGDYPPITAQNVANLQEVEVLGNGAMNDAVAWLPDGGIVVAASRGVYIYENLQAEPCFIELGVNVQSLLAANETLFFSDRTNLYAYDLANQQILYSLEGQKPLAVSNYGAMLAYEVDMGVRVLEIETGEVLHDLSYEGILEDEYYYEEEESSLENSFVFAQFLSNDGGVIVRWVRWISDERWEGGYLAGNDIWSFNETPQPSPIDYDFISYSWDFAALDANWNFFAVDESSVHSTNASFSLDLQEDELLEAEHNNLGFALKGNYFAAPTVHYDSRERSTKIWDVTTGELVANFSASGHISFSPDASKVAIGRHIFELATGEETAFLQTDTYSLLIGLQDRVLQYASDDSLRLLDSASLEEIALLPMTVSELKERPYMANADGSFLLRHKDNQSIIHIDGNTGAEIARFHDDTPSEYYYPVIVSPDLQYLLIPHYLDGVELVSIWNANTGERIALPQFYNPISPYFYLSNILIVWDAVSSEILFYDIANAAIVKQFPTITHEGVGNMPLTLSLSPDMRYLFINSRVNHVIWSVADETEVLRIESQVWDWAFSPDSVFFAYQDENMVNVVNLLDSSVIIEIQADGNIYFTADRILALADYYDYENVRYVDVISGEEVFDPIVEERPMYEANGLRFFNDGMSIRAESNQNHVLAMLDTGFVSSMRMSSDGKLIIISYYDGRLGIWAVVE